MYTTIPSEDTLTSIVTHTHLLIDQVQQQSTMAIKVEISFSHYLTGKAMQENIYSYTERPLDLLTVSQSDLEQLNMEKQKISA